ncbi:stage 0 sporulation family protein [Ihubacter sp. mB4P-1]|uniref:PSP1 domain-containing protein n=1 Tax=Ihubacter sp. mB4P-1 TaxID=3242370 RepID=UPI003C7A67A3
MVRVAGVRFKNAGKVYYFDPDELEIRSGDNVIVETARGLEFGTVTMDITEIREEDVVQPLKKIIRIAGEEDIRRHEENERKKAKALKACQEKINKHGLEMKLIDVEYTFDNNKIIFYFTADGRVDFRELVKDLAGVFKMRIELRQIGVRDEAKMLGGIGSCGKSLCCSTWLSDFEPVSIKMAKVQNLSLNPTKISGICGRLMCCLKYENDIYMELRKGLPDNGERVKTRDGIGKVVDTNILSSKVMVRLYTGEKDEDGQEKLGTEIYTYKKEDIKRMDRHKKNSGHNGKNGNQNNNSLLAEVDEEYIEELKELIKE